MDRPALPQADGSRVAAFCSGVLPGLFHAVAYRNDVFRPDPFDVESIHAEARDRFRDLVGHASDPSRGSTGRIQLLLGEAGSGKTHLMRAFREALHGEGRGYCGYLQMTSATDHYGRYLLHNLIDSLERPYHERLDPRSSLLRLSTALAESVPGVPAELLDRIRDGESDPGDLAAAVDELTNRIVFDERFDRIDSDLVTALLYLQADNPRVKSRVARYLRCEPLSERDRALLGGLDSRSYDDAPQRLIVKLAELMLVLHEAPLVLCVDQLEDLFDLDRAGVRFRRSLATLNDLVGRIPSLIVVIACLEDYFIPLREHLTKPIIDRIERDPDPIRLKGLRERDEVVALISSRLRHLFQECNIRCTEYLPTAPIPDTLIDRVTGMRTRDVLQQCQAYRERCMLAGGIVPDDSGPLPPPPPDGDVQHLEQAWNDHLSSFSDVLPDDEEGLAELLAGAIRHCSDAVETGHAFEASVKGSTIAVSCSAAGEVLWRLRVGVCNKSAKGGGLARQVEQVDQLAGKDPAGTTPVLVRSTAFPGNPATQIARQIGEFLSRGGRRAVVEDVEWRAMAAMPSFRRKYADSPVFTAWLRQSRPISSLPSLRTILGLDDLTPVAQRESTVPEPTAGDLLHNGAGSSPGLAGSDGPSGNGRPAPGPHPVEELGAITLGVTEGRLTRPVTLDPEVLTRHAAFLGGTGSGKTTLALNVVEQLLLRGIPTILVDRKGDLCGYARPEIWSSPIDDPELSARRDRLREQVDLAIYTPGDPSGRPLTIDVAPADLAEASSTDRLTVARQAATALAGMMGYGAGSRHQTRLVILSCAINVLAQVQPGTPITLDLLADFVAEHDPALVNAIGNLDPKQIQGLTQDLEVLRLGRGALLGSVGEPLRAEALLGLGTHTVPGKTRLSVISTKFLGDQRDLEFWVSQLLIELGRWAARSPSKRLQAVVLFDEADLYLPAVRKPATKEPLENLLRRGRSAGLGVLLASQNPGDFDYKCRDNVLCWFLGRISQDVSIAKMKPLLSACRGDIASRLAGQETGQFQFGREGTVVALRGARSVLVTEQLPEGEILTLARLPGPRSPTEPAPARH
ncbi:helicase HerA-like domain-containing protein [Tautonia sociabilis]|uniref:DUF853 family protein n=1 Tax=Tautonia sociabilis TaxID=2080755 RepID=A0A432MI09_9BACT|nr:helicase HerA-like domain-containing protein [Tautonia sociabilis]RUL86823.1 DUF853 family protein [Tautonia sociabilis]